MSELDPIINLLSGKFGWLPTVLAYLVALQAAVKLFNARLQRWIADRVASIVDSPGDDDDQMLTRILSLPWYKRTAFVLDLSLRIKLPSLADYQLALRKRVAGIAANPNNPS